MKTLRNLLVSENAATATEYAVMLALIIVAALTAITTLGTAVSGKFDEVATAVSGTGGTTP